MSRFLTVAATLYAAVIVALALLWSFGPADVKWLTLSSMFAPLLFAPLFLLAPLAFFVRSGPLRASALVLLGLFIVLFGARFLPPGPAGAEGAAELRVVTFNQLNTNARVDTVLGALLAQDADLIALQELSPAVAAALETRLKTAYPYAEFRAAEGTTGIGLFSRYPITSVAYEWIPQVQRATVRARGVDLTVLNVHAPAPYDPERSDGFLAAYDPRQREPRFGTLLERIDEASGPLVVLGDFNLSDREPRYGDLSARLTDAYRAAAWGFGFTFPNYTRVRGVPVPPLIRIDYVWMGGGVTPIDAEVVCEGGSDHCMVVADVGIPGEVPSEPAETAENATEDVTKDGAEDPFEITVNFTDESALGPASSPTGGAAGTP